jgi:hypothetical protein
VNAKLGRIDFRGTANDSDGKKVLELYLYTQMKTHIQQIKILRIFK